MEQQIINALQEKIFDLRHAQQNDYNAAKRAACQAAIVELYKLIDRINAGDQSAMRLAQSVLSRI